MIDLNCCGIYKITNSINNKYYIGSSNNVKIRTRKHFELLKQNKHHSIFFQNAYNKYGRDVFSIELSEKCTKNNKIIIEQQYLDNIDDWKNVYNISKIASGGYDLTTHPRQHEIRRKMSISSKGRGAKPFYIDDIRYETLKDASIIFNVDIKSISSKLKNWKNKNYFYENNPKIGKYGIQHHSIYFYKPIKIYYCKCGIIINKYSKTCDNCRNLNRKNKIYINKIIINDVEFISLKEASIKLNIGYATLIYRLKSKTITFKDYYFKDKPKDINNLISFEEINLKISEKNKGNVGHNNKPFYVYNMFFNSLSLASKILKISRTTLGRRLKSNNFRDYLYIIF